MKGSGRMNGEGFWMTDKPRLLQQRSWYRDVMASFARVDREATRRDEDWIRLRDPRNTV